MRHDEHRRSIHNFRLLMEALGGKDKQLAQLVDASNAVFETFAKEDAERPAARCTCCRARCTRPGTGLGKLGAAASERARPDAAQAAAVRQRARRRRNEATRKLREDDDADHQERDPPVRARNPARRSTNSARRRKQLAEAFPKLASELLGAQRILQRARLQPRQEQGRLPVLPRLGQPQPQQRRQLADAHGPLGRSLVYFNCEIAADPQRRRAKSTERSTCWSACSSRRPRQNAKPTGIAQGRKRRRPRASRAARPREGGPPAWRHSIRPRAAARRRGGRG